MLVGPNDRGIEHQAFQIRVFPDRQQPRPDLALAPSIEPLEDGVPLAKTLGKVSPGSPRSCNPKDRIDKKPIVERGPAWITLFAGQQISYLLPLLVRNLVSPHSSSLNRTATRNTKNAKNLQDVCQHDLVCLPLVECVTIQSNSTDNSHHPSPSPVWSAPAAGLYLPSPPVHRCGSSACWRQWCRGAGRGGCRAGGA